MGHGTKRTACATAAVIMCPSALHRSGFGAETTSVSFVEGFATAQATTAAKSNPSLISSQKVSTVPLPDLVISARAPLLQPF